MIEIEPNYPKRNAFKDDDFVCYCFKYAKRDIEKDFMGTGRSLIYEKIALEKKAGRCNCAAENPKGK